MTTHLLTIKNCQQIVYSVCCRLVADRRKSCVPGAGWFATAWLSLAAHNSKHMPHLVHFGSLSLGRFRIHAVNSFK